MGTAIAKGLLINKVVSSESLEIVDVNPTAAYELKNKYKLKVNEYIPTEWSGKAIILAVKPNVIEKVAPKLIFNLKKIDLLISIAAGKKISNLSSLLAGYKNIVRVMPNIPSEIGMGMSVAYTQFALPNNSINFVEKLFSSIGEILWVDKESDMDAVTAISGSGPAYVFLLIEALVSAGKINGLSKELSMNLALMTVKGAGALAHYLANNEPIKQPNELRDSVTSPNGTTEAALNVLMNNNVFLKLIIKAVTNAKDRSIELSK